MTTRTHNQTTTHDTATQPRAQTEPKHAPETARSEAQAHAKHASQCTGHVEITQRRHWGAVCMHAPVVVCVWVLCVCMRAVCMCACCTRVQCARCVGACRCCACGILTWPPRQHKAAGGMHVPAQAHTHVHGRQHTP